MYSLCEKNKMHKKQFCEPFDLVLVPGPYSYDEIAKYTKSVIVGYPKFDDFFKSLIKKDVILKELNLNIDTAKKTIFYAPTFNLFGRSSIPIFYQEIIKLSIDFNVIFKPHIYTDINEKNLIKIFENDNIFIESALTRFDKLLAISDVLIGDVQSGVPWEGVTTNKPTIACFRKSRNTFENLEKEIIKGEVVPIVKNHKI